MPALFPTLSSQVKRLATVRLLPDVINAINLLVKGLSGSFTLPATDFSDSVIIEKDQASAFAALTLLNDAAGANAHVYLKLQTHDGASGDPYVWLTNGVTSWVVGLDNSDADALVISRSASPGGTNGVRIDAVTLDALLAGKLVWQSGTPNGVTLTHAATAPRTLTVQDLSGIVVLLGASAAVANAGHLGFVDGLYDIGQLAPPLRPRDLFLSRNAAVGGTLAVTGMATLTGGFNALASSTVQGALNVTGIVAANGQPIAATPQSQPLSPTQNLTNAYLALSGCAATLTPGNWIVMLVCDFLEVGAGDVGQTFLGRVVVGSGTATIANATAVAVLAGVTANQRATVSQVWFVNVTATAVVRAEAQKTGGSGTSQAIGTVTALTAWYVGSP